MIFGLNSRFNRNCNSHTIWSKLVDHKNIVLIPRQGCNQTVMKENINWHYFIKLEDQSNYPLYDKHLLTCVQAITLTSDIPTWRIKCPQCRKNCQIYPTKCWKNVMERKLLFSIINYWFSVWIKPCKPRFIMGENGGCWQSCRGWPQTLPLNCSNQFTLMPLLFSHVN